MSAPPSQVHYDQQNGQCPQPPRSLPSAARAVEQVAGQPLGDCHDQRDPPRSRFTQITRRRGSPLTAEPRHRCPSVAPPLRVQDRPRCSQRVRRTRSSQRPTLPCAHRAGDRSGPVAQADGVTSRASPAYTSSTLRPLVVQNDPSGPFTRALVRAIMAMRRLRCAASCVQPDDETLQARERTRTKREP